MHSSSRGGLLGLAALSAAFLISCGGNNGTGGSSPGATVAVVAGTPATATISLLAGGLGGATFANGTGTNTRFNRPGGIVMDSQGNTFVADTFNDVIREITPTGTVSTFAGIAGTASYFNSQGTSAAFNNPKGLAIDSQGTIYVADYSNHVIRAIAADGTVTRLAGYAGVGSFLDGSKTSTTFFNHPTGVAVDAALNVYVADTGNNVIRRITHNGDVTTYAGTGTAGSANGPAAAATFSGPQGVAVDSQGNVYVADTGNYCIRKISPTGDVTTLAGTINSPGSIDGSNALFLNPSAIVLANNNLLMVADGNTLRQVDATGAVTTLAGKATATGTTDGTGSSARFKTIGALAVDNTGNLHVADTGNSLIRTMDSITLAVTTVAGSVSPNGTIEQTGTADNSGSLARFNVPTGISVDSAGNVYVADTSSNTIRKITAAGIVSTLAGSAGTPGAGNGAASLATFRVPTGTAVNSSSGVVYVADAYNNMIRSISPQGGGLVVGVPAGSSGAAGSADGTGAAATFNAPIGVAIDKAGTVYVTDAGTSIIRKMTAAGVVTTLAGLAGTTGAADGQGQTARFHSPSGLTVDPNGIVYVADSVNNTIRKITVDGTVTTLAGSYNAKGAVDGVGNAASFNDPVGVALDSAGNLYVADSNNFVIRKITLDGTLPYATVSTVVGTAGVEGVVTGTGGTLGKLYGITIDSSDQLYVTTENSILKITLSALPDAALTATPQTLTLGQGTTLNWWSSANTVGCSASDGWAGTQATSGASFFTPSSLGSQTYSLTCSNADGATTKKSVSVTVAAAAPTPTLILSASPTSITLGQTTVLTWSSTNTIACGASGNWADNQAVNGSTEITPTATGTMTYTLNCSNDAQTAFVTKSVAVKVTAAATTTTSTSSSSSSSGGAAGLDLLTGLGLLGWLRRSRRVAP